MIELSLAIIAKDEEANLDACLRSIKGHADEIIVVDTGSSDRTPEVAERHGAKVYIFDPSTHPESFFRDDEETCKTFGAPGPFSGEVMLGDFGAARRFSFSKTQGEFITWVDADDVVKNAEKYREAVADMKRRGLDMGFLAYDYARDSQGRVYYRQWRERIIKRDAAVWINPVHEVLLPARPVNTSRYDTIEIQHCRKADRKSVPNRNYKILLRQFEADKKNGAVVDPRTLFYLGQEARWVEPNRSAEFYEDYLKRSGWPEERAAAHVALGSMCEFGQFTLSPEDAYARADREFAAAAAEMPENPDGFFGLARIAQLRSRWQDCVNYTDRGFKIGNPDSMLGANPLDRVYRPHVHYNFALSHLGRYEEAAASCRAGLAACPDDPGVPGGSPGMLKLNLEIYEKHLAAEKAKAQPAQQQPAGVVVEFNKMEDVNVPPVANIPQDALIIYALQLWKQVAHLERDAGKAERFLEGLPRAVQNDPVCQSMREATRRMLAPRVERTADGDVIDIGTNSDEPRREYARIHAALAPKNREIIAKLFTGMGEPLSIVFWTGPSIEPWCPKTPDESGIGGSETACVEMARELAARGHSVTVYAECQGMEGEYDGVRYHHWPNAQAHLPIKCDVFISSRQPAVMNKPSDVEAGIKLLWVHDVHVGPDSPEMQRWLLRFDRILCLSQWHKQFFLSCYPTLDPDRVVITRNGIRPERFQRNPVAIEGAKLGVHLTDDPFIKHNRLIYSSSPNRGLDTLLINFPFIKQRVPDAELHVYYGWDCWQKFAEMRNDQGELQDIARRKQQLADAVRDGGVFDHGRVNQRALAEAFMRSKVWGYPTSFTETSCVTAMEAQAAGCVPVATRLAALGETIKHGTLLDPGPDYGRQFVDECVRLLTDDEYRESFAKPARAWALESLSWKSLAGDWETMFRKIADEMRVDPLPKFMEAR